MSVGNVDFYKVRGSLSSGEYPLLGYSSLPAPTASFSDVLYPAGLQTTVSVPWFSGADSVNVARIGSDYYWVTEYHERTADARQYTFTLDYMAPTSLLRYDQNVDMCLTRSPVYLCPYLSDPYSKGITRLHSTQRLGNLIYDYSSPDEALFWVQVTCQTTGGGGLTSFKRFGCFVVIDKTDDIADVDLKHSCYADTDGSAYPSLFQIMNYPEIVIQTTGAAIQDISISRRCPYEYRLRSFDGGSKTCINLIDANGGNIIKGNDPDAPDMYNIDAIIDTVANDYKIYTMTPNTSDRMMGILSVRDWNKNIIVQFPTSQSTRLTVQTYADMTGIYTIIDNGEQRISVPEGKLPWNGSAWSEYKAYQMDTDRTIMQNAQRYARFDFETRDVAGGVSQFGNALNNMIFGAIAGKGAGAIAGGIGGALNMWASGYENKRALQLAWMQANDTFELSQIQAQNAMGTAYGVGYGLIYVALCVDNDNLIAGYDEPANDSDELLADYTDRCGYPCEGRHTVSIEAGYYKGFIPSTSTLNGMKFDELNRVMMNGFKFVYP